MDTTAPKPFVFVIMPFGEEFNDIYEFGIKLACKDAGAYCERVDEQFFEGSILERIYNQIAKADIIVADLSGRNPNVFYETGYAHALGKRVIHLTKDANDIPFDLKHYPHIVYQGKITCLKSDLEQRIRWSIDNPNDRISTPELDFQLYISGVELTEFTEVPCFWSLSRPEIKLRIDIHNPTNRIFTEMLSFGIVTPEIFSQNSKNDKVVHLPDGRYMHLVREAVLLWPEGWESITLPLFANSNAWNNESFEIEVTLYSQFGNKKFNVRLDVSLSEVDIQELI